MNRVRLAAAAVLAVAAVGVAPARAQVDDAAAGQIVDFDILPDVLTVESGTTITWTNSGARPHTVTDRGGMFDTGPVLPGAGASVTLDVPGTYEVFCRINPSSMNATVVVEPGDDPPPAVRVQAFDDAREGEVERFDPPELEVPVGTELILANVGGQPHSLRAEDKAADLRIPVVEPGAEQGRFAGGNRSVVLLRPGTFAFFCEIHPDTMRGTVVVDGEAPPPVPPPTTEPPGDPPERPPPQGDATMEDFSFSPSELEAEPGAEVTWTNAGDEAHTATFDDVDLDTGPVEPGESASLDAPDDPGTYSYFCAIHPEMRGALLVQRPDVVVAPPPPRRADPPDGTVVAYALAAVLLATGAAGAFLGLRGRRPPAPAPTTAVEF